VTRKAVVTGAEAVELPEDLEGAEKADEGAESIVSKTFNL
jgi:hypothetical protein